MDGGDHGTEGRDRGREGLEDAVGPDVPRRDREESGEESECGRESLLEQVGTKEARGGAGGDREGERGEPGGEWLGRRLQGKQGLSAGGGAELIAQDRVRDLIESAAVREVGTAGFDPK